MNSAAQTARNWQVYDAPELLSQLSAVRENGRREMLFRVDGLHCINCVRNLERALSDCTRQARVDLGAGTAEVQWLDAESSPSRIFEAVERAGYRPSPLVEQPELRDEQKERRALLLRLGVAGLLGMQVMMTAATQYFLDVAPEPLIAALLRYSQWIMATPVLLYSGWPLLASAARALRAGQLNMDVPVSLALVLAYGASCVNVVTGEGHIYYDSVTMFVFLLLTARWFEGRGRAAAARRLRELEAAQPLSATIERNGSLQQVSAAALRSGDVVVVAPGAALAADGALLDASAALDESMLSGEALPATRQAGERVHAGTINAGLSSLRIRVTDTGAATTLSRINNLVHRAQMDKPRVQQLADRIAGLIVAGVLVAAVAGAAYWWPTSPSIAFNVALAVLVVTCPCALSLATPLALAAASSNLAARGVLLVRADALLRLPAVTTVCFDKTGTLTTGEMQIDIREGEPGFALSRSLAIAAALERGLHHPVARAFQAYETPELDAQDVELLPGIGVHGSVAGTPYRLVSRVAPWTSQAPHPLTWLSLQRGGVEIARFGLSHTLRNEAAATVSSLERRGLHQNLISGDALPVVLDTAAQLGIRSARGGLKPEDKLSILTRLQADGQKVWMVGDGINDAPVLAAADVSTSFTSASALAQSRADLLLLRDELAALPHIHTLARRTQAVVRENLGWAVAYNLVAVPLALSGGLTPWIAALGMGISSITVVLNALRLLRNPKQAAQPWSKAPRTPHQEVLAS